MRMAQSDALLWAQVHDRTFFYPLWDKIDHMSAPPAQARARASARRGPLLRRLRAVAGSRATGMLSPKTSVPPAPCIAALSRAAPWPRRPSCSARVVPWVSSATCIHCVQRVVTAVSECAASPAAMHLWESLAWDKYISKLTEDYIRNVDNNFNNAVRRFLTD
jgi:hypothetical protein